MRVKTTDRSPGRGRCQGPGRWERVTGLPFQLRKKNVLEPDGGDGCPAALLSLRPLSCSLEMVKMVNFVMCIGHNFQKRKEKERRTKMWSKLADSDPTMLPVYRF